MGFFKWLARLFFLKCYNLFLAIARFCEAIIDYLADEQRATAAGITAAQFEGEVFSAYDTLFTLWLQSKDPRVMHLVLIISSNFAATFSCS